MLDFSLTTYKTLIQTLQKEGYCFQTLENHSENPSFQKTVILRHDIDIFALSALQLAQIETELDVKGSYYFRTTKFSNQPEIIKKIASLGHEIGYHYEDLTRNNGDIEAAKKDFKENLEWFRMLYPVRTVCMHGRSGSPYDNRDLWKHIRLSDYDLIAEPYLSLDFNKVLYLSDTTQKWDGNNIAVRDKVETTLNYRFRTTFDIIKSVGDLPDKIMITIHPELWSKSLAGWLLVKLYVFTHSSYKKYYRNKKMLKRKSVIT